ncbi:MAG: 50S ribosomal protein L19e [Candidatus Nanoarchaeia archaeon]|nr:50S ribosomal protein L19e [Candidatus Nanoarchaeia archaeon]
MRLGPQRRLSANLLGIGKHRIRFNQDKLEEIKEAITKEDLRGLIREKAITKDKKSSHSRSRARKILSQKRKGRRKGQGSRKGKFGARINRKETWMNKVRSQRDIIKLLREKKQISNKDYRMLYLKVKGGFFRSKRHLRMYMEEKNLIEKNATVKKKKTR